MNPSFPSTSPAPAMSSANFQPTTTELALSNQIFLLADPQKLGIITGDAAIKVFGGANLTNIQLGEIWAIADAENNGFLTRKGVAMALRLIGWAQKGETPTAALLSKPGPVAHVDGVTSNAIPRSTASPAPKSPQPTSAVSTSSLGLQPPLLPPDRAKYLKLFNSSGPVNGLLPGDKAREIFLRSKLPFERLSQIWNLADTRSRGALDTTDFIIAMYLIQASMSNKLPTVPATLPVGLIEAASGSVTSHSTGASSTGTASPTVTAFNTPKPILRNVTGQSSQFPSPQPTSQVPATRPQPPAIPPRNAAFPLAAPPPPPVQQQWDVSAQDKAKFDTFFDALDTQRSGYVGGDVAGPFLVDSTLPEDVLAQIWDLVDSRGEGRLSRDQFAVVMHLINSKLAGKDLPTVLPSTLVPPSLRSSGLGNSTFLNSAFQVPIPPQSHSIQQDLFSLDDTPPPSAVQAPVQPQFSGQVSQQTTGVSPQLPRQITGQAVTSPFNAPVASPFGQTVLATSAGFSQVAPTTSMAFNQFQHRPAPPPPQQQVHKDLLGDDDDEIAAAILHTSAEIGNVKNQLASTERSLETTRQDRETAEKTIESNAAQLAALQTQLASAKASFETESKLLATLKERYAEQSREITKTREELIGAESDLSAVKLEKTEVGSASLRDKDEVRALQKKMKEVADETELLKAELEKAKKDARQQKGLLAIAKKQLASAEADRARVKKELEDAQAETVADKKEMDDVNEAIEKLNAAAAIAPVVAAPLSRSPSLAMPVEEAMVPITSSLGSDTPAAIASPPITSLNPFAALVRQDTLSSSTTPPRVVSPFGTLPFAATSLPTPPIGTAVASHEDVVNVSAMPGPMSAASTSDDPFGLDKFDEVFSTPTELSPTTSTSPPPGLDAFIVEQVASSSAFETPEVKSETIGLPLVEGQRDVKEVNEPSAPEPSRALFTEPERAVSADSTEYLPPIQDIETADDDSSSDEDEAGGKFTHVTKPGDSDDWASAKEHSDSAHADSDAAAGKQGPTFDDLFTEPSTALPVDEATTSLARAKSMSPTTSNTSSPRQPLSILLPRSLSSTSLSAKDPFGVPQSFEATPFEPPVGEHVPPPIIETVLEPSPAGGDTIVATASGVSDFDEAMGRLPGSGADTVVQFSSTFDDNFDFSSTTFEPAPVPTVDATPPVSNGDKGGFDDVFGFSGTATQETVVFPSVSAPPATNVMPAENKSTSPNATFDDIFGTTDTPALATTGKSNGHAPTESISTTASGPGSTARPLSPTTSGSHGVSTPPRQASPPPAGLGRSTSMRFRSSSPKPKEKNKAKDSPESGTRHSKLSLSFFSRKKDKKPKSDGQHLSPPEDAAGGAVTPAAEDDIDGVKQLCAMGFSRTQAVTALEKHGYDVQLALNSLLQ